MLVSCLEFSGKTRTVPDINSVKSSWFCSAIFRHLTWAEVSSVSHTSPVKQREISKTVLTPTACECLPSDGAHDWLLFVIIICILFIFPIFPCHNNNMF